MLNLDTVRPEACVKAPYSYLDWLQAAMHAEAVSDHHTIRLCWQKAYREALVQDAPSHTLRGLARIVQYYTGKEH